MKIARLALSLFLLAASAASSQPFAMVGAETLCRGTLPNVTDLDCTGVVDDAGWSAAMARLPDGRLVFIGWMGAEVSAMAPDGTDDELLGYLPESHKMGAAQAAADAAGIVYYTLIDGTLWLFNPDACGDLQCSPTMVGPVETAGGDPVNTIGGDMAFDRMGRLWMMADLGKGSQLYRIDKKTARASMATDGPEIESPAWGMSDSDDGLVAFSDDLHAWLLPGPIDLGLVGYDWPEEHGDAASEVRFACELEVEVGPPSPRRAMLGADDGQLEATIRVLHVRPETVDTRLRFWIERNGERVSRIVSQDLTLDYLEGWGWRGPIPTPREPGSYRIVVEIARMNQGTARAFATFEIGAEES